MNPSSLAGHTVELLERVVGSQLPSDRVIQDFYRERRYLGSHDRRWITEKTYDVIRNFIFLRELSRRCTGKSGPFDVFLAYEIAFAGLSGKDLESSYPLLFESYRMSGEKLDLHTLSECIGAEMNELKKNSQDTPLYFSFPDFFPSLLPENVRGELTPLMAALNREARVCVRVDTNRITRDEAARAFAGRGIETEPTRYSPLGLHLSRRVNLNNDPLYKEGLVEIQEEASQLIGLLVDPQTDETIVDACAGAGGKSLEIAALAAGRCRILALDVDKNRLRNLDLRAKRSGYADISPVRVTDGLLGEAERFAGAADKVVVDAPCTGSGTIRRNPDKKFRLTISAVEKHAEYQNALLERYSELVRVGGILVYSTCSMFADENFRVVESFLSSAAGFRREDVSRLLRGKEFAGLVEDGYLVTYPHRHDMDGFFAAVMRRVS